RWRAVGSTVPMYESPSTDSFRRAEAGNKCHQRRSIPARSGVDWHRTRNQWCQPMDSRAASTAPKMEQRPEPEYKVPSAALRRTSYLELRGKDKKLSGLSNPSPSVALEPNYS